MIAIFIIVAVLFVTVIFFALSIVKERDEMKAKKKIFDEHDIYKP